MVLTIDFNYRGIIWYSLIGLMFVAAMFVVSAHAEPANISFDDKSYVIVETIEGPVNITTVEHTANHSISNQSHYISQGEVVYVGDTIDISGVVPPYPFLAYWNGYDMYDSVPSFCVTLSQRKIGYYQFYLDPAWAESRIGKWYKYNGAFERQGNNLAFIVAPRPYYNYTLTYPNGTTIDVVTLPELQYGSPIPLPTPEIMPRSYVADYLVTSDEELNISVPALSAGWIFDGTDNSILYRINNTDNQIAFTAKEIGEIEPGDYKMLIQTIGNSAGTLDVIFSQNIIKWFDRSAFKVRELSTINMVPTEAIRQLKTIFPKTHDSYQIKSLTIQEPSITIGYMEEISVGGAKEYYQDTTRRGNVSLMEVRGYTNVRPGVNVSVTLDEHGVSPRDLSGGYTYRSQAQGTYLGDMRYYRVYVPMYWDDMKPGMHNLTARTALGGYAIANFPVREESPESYVPPQRIRFADDGNPWKPNLTIPDPVVIEKEKIVEKVVTVQLTPSPEEITSSAREIVDRQNADTERIVLAAVGLVIGLAGIGWFAWSLWRAKKK